MRSTFRTDWKVFYPSGSFMAATKHPADAAILVSSWGKGSKIKYGHSLVVWTEGKEEFSARNNEDRVGKICFERVNENRRKALENSTDGLKKSQPERRPE